MKQGLLQSQNEFAHIFEEHVMKKTLNHSDPESKKQVMKAKTCFSSDVARTWKWVSMCYLGFMPPVFRIFLLKTSQVTWFHITRVLVSQHHGRRASELLGEAVDAEDVELIIRLWDESRGIGQREKLLANSFSKHWKIDRTQLRPAFCQGPVTDGDRTVQVVTIDSLVPVHGPF